MNQVDGNRGRFSLPQGSIAQLRSDRKCNQLIRKNGLSFGAARRVGILEGPGGGQSCARSEACAGCHFSINLNGETFAPAPRVEQQNHAKNARDRKKKVERWQEFLDQKMGPPGGPTFGSKKNRIAILLRTCANRIFFGPQNWSARRTHFLVQKFTPSLSKNCSMA